MKKYTLLFLTVLIVACSSDAPKNSNVVESVLYLGKGQRQPLIVGLGGSEGGNSWSRSRWKKTRDRFIDEGYAFLAIGYFGAEGTSEQLDRISIDAVHDAILKAAGNPLIDGSKIAVIGGSKGGELALLLASHYKEIKCVVALVPSNCTFPALTMMASTSSWSYQGKEVPYVPMPWSAVPSALKHDLRSAFEIMIRDTVAVNRALIVAEKINGPIFLLSAKKDEMWPSTEMSDALMARLKSKNFPFPYQHIAIDGGHTDVLDHFDLIFDFLKNNFK